MKTIKICLIIITFLTLASAIGCNITSAEKGSKASLDCSRSLFLGEGVIGSIGFSLDESHNKIHIVYPHQDNKIIYQQFTIQGEPLLSTDYNFTGQLKAPRIAFADDGELHFIYSNRLSGGQLWELWYTKIGVNGELYNKPKKISESNINVGDFSIAPDNVGGAFILWSASGEGGINIFRVDALGNPIAGPLEFSSNGMAPSMFVSAEGTLHLSWVSNGNLFYAESPVDNIQAMKGSHVADLGLRSGDGLSGPEIGVSDGWVYVIWSIFSHTGLEAGSARTSFVSFQVGEPALSESKPVWISMDEELIYSPYLGTLPLTQIAYPPQNPSGVSDIISNPATVKESASEMAAALVVKQNLRMNDQLQIAVALFDQGLYTSNFFASKTTQMSDDPVISLDTSGNIYLVWREGISGQKIYYATTNPDVIAEIDRLNSTDIINALLEGGTESLIGIAFMPFIGFGWLLPGLIVIGIWKLYIDQESIHELKAWIPLIISVVIYYATKISTLPTMLTYVPFSAWLYIPSNWENILRIGIPLIIFAIAIMVAHYVSIRFSESALVYYLSLTFTDAILTLAIYGVNFLGVF